MYIAVCGNNYSGKSTIANIVSNNFRWKLISSKDCQHSMGLLETFFANIERCFLSVQSLFLIEKAQAILQCVANGENFVVDRSIYEDENVFAKLWLDNYSIPSWDKVAYTQLVSFVNNILPTPDIKIYCKCSLKVINERREKRHKRVFEQFYPDNFLTKLQSYYNSDAYFNNAFSIDMDSVDFENRDNIELLQQDISKLLLDRNALDFSIIKRGNV